MIVLNFPRRANVPTSKIHEIVSYINEKDLDDVYSFLTLNSEVSLL